MVSVFSSDLAPADPSLIDIVDNNDVPEGAQIDAYGYGSDSDLDECEDTGPASKPINSKDHATSKEDDE